MLIYSDHEQLAYDEYVDFLKRCDLGSQYPKQRFESRIRTLLKNTDITITARNEMGLLVGICFGLTDFAYFLFVSDLGVDRQYVGRGIGRELLRRLIDRAGGAADISVTTISNDEAIGFYEKCGLRNKPDLMVRYCDEWESFTVS